MGYWVVAICVILFAFNLWGIARGWKAEFGYVTRGDMVFFTLMAAILPVGFLIALGSLATPNMRTAWSRFWNKDVM